MNYLKRKYQWILAAGVVFGLLILVASPVFAADGDFSQDGEPYLFLPVKKLQEIRLNIRKNPYKRFFKGVLSKAEKAVKRNGELDSAEYNHRSFTVFGNEIETLAFCYLVSGETRFLESVKLRMASLSTEQTWLLEDNMTSAIVLRGLSIGYNWLYQYMEPEFRSLVASRITRQAEILYTAYTQNKAAWSKNYLGNHNHNCMIALAIASFALHGDSGSVEKWFEAARDNFTHVLSLLPTDGVPHEGVAYGTPVNMMLYGLLLRDAVGDDSVFNHGFLKNYAKFRLYASLPGYIENINFADSPLQEFAPSGGPGYMLRLAASVYQDGNAQWLADAIDEAREYRNPHWLDLVWYDGSVSPTAPDSLPNYAVFEDSSLFLYRSDWSDGALWVAFRAGAVQGLTAWEKGVFYGSHAHPDQGNILLWKNGRWILKDDGYVDLKQSQNHNVLLVAGKGQLGEGGKWYKAGVAARFEAKASLLVELETSNKISVCGKIAGMYDPGLGLVSWDRCVTIHDGGVVVVRDSVECAKETRLDFLYHFADPEMMLEGDIISIGSDTRLAVSLSPRLNRKIERFDYKARVKGGRSVISDSLMSVYGLVSNAHITSVFYPPGINPAEYW